MDGEGSEIVFFEVLRWLYYYSCLSETTMQTMMAMKTTVVFVMISAKVFVMVRMRSSGAVVVVVVVA